MSAPGPTDCLTDAAIAAFAHGKLPPEGARRVEEHLRGCGACARLVAEYAKALFEPGGGEAARPPHGPLEDARAEPPPAAPAGDEPLAPGTRVSRYTIVGVRGRGGGGTVYEAHDEQLKRRIGLKLLRRDVAAGLPEAEAQARLLQEAQSMAQLAHPNVVGVHDAGVHEGRVFIVMELVEGETLARWLARRPHGPREVLETFVAAGRGLAAIHAAGLVHGDFKPDNVLVGGSGQVRVTDLGLARPLGGAPAATADARASAGSGGSSGGAYTIAGGTPVYMSPEQFQRKARDARSDQFSFCVAVFRALYRADPFGDEPRRRWASAADTGEPLAETPIAGVDAPGGVPRAVYAVLARGLRVSADDRYPSMDALLADLVAAAGLDRRAGMRRPPWWAFGVAAGAAVAALWAWRAGGGGAARCGDGVVRAPIEECDDGNQVDGDGCSASCLRCREGDAAFVWSGNGHCYSRHDEPASWSEAQRRCAEGGGALVAFGGAAEAKAVLASLLADRPHDTWIGLRRASVARGFVWATGEPLAESLASWFAEFPKPPGADCVRQFPHADPFFIPAGWPAAPCDERRAFVCERAPWVANPRDGHAYHVFHARVPWDEARKACERRGAHLARLEEAEEHAFLASRASVDVWIDARDADGAGAFTFSTGRPVVFRAFAAGEPDNPRPPSCVALGEDDLWHDRACGLPFAYACEVE